MYRLSLIALMALGSLTVASISADAQQIYYPQPTQPARPVPTQPSYIQPATFAQPSCPPLQRAYTSHAAPVRQRTFLFRFRADKFARSLQQQGYIVEVRRTGLLNLRWSVRYRRA